MIGGPNSGTNGYVAQSRHHLDRIYALYNNVKESMEKAKTACKSAITFCEEIGREAKTKKNTTRVIGGTVTAGAIVTGIIVAGLFTFGIGTAVGLGITAVAAGGAITTGAVTAGAAGVGTHLLATKFKSIEDTCRKQCSKFDDFNDQTSALNPTMLKLLTDVDYIEDAKKCALYQDHQIYTVDLPVRGAKECRKTLRKLRRELDALSEKIK